MLRLSLRSPALRILAILILVFTLGASTAFAAPTPGDRAQGLISQILTWSADSLFSWWAPSGVPTGGTGGTGDDGTDDGSGGSDDDDGGAGGLLDPNGAGGDGTGGTGGTGGTSGTGTGGTDGTGSV